ncbi:ABC transporter ATP-binding protein/permease [Rhodobium gokarnense]|uniref:ATP-binding cassette transporter n=1 Tax=Rhodobium gokarnense TaxID=364296 RepID=A0ABT3HFJ1_9HYPH|nr:ABC transporter ATP-binding protein/permease [Rhodobium gokarnense]MCW2309046.1 putative ATP-binding cassette transporter [Rhodobium gokarnense]
MRPPVFEERLSRQLLTLARSINGTPGRTGLYVLCALITGVIIATAAAQVWLNAWNEPFYNAIEKKDLDGFFTQLGVFVMIAAVLLLLNVAQRYLDMTIALKLRQMATGDLIENWMSHKRAARIGRAGQIGVNPDQRIHEDANHLTELTTSLGVGLLQATLLLSSFIGVLWVLSQGVVLKMFGYSFSIPGYMVWAALLYAITGSAFSWLVGRRLVKLQQTRYAREADLRVALVQGAEHSDGIVLNNGERHKREALIGDLDKLLDVLRRIVMATVGLTWLTAGYGWVALVFPIIVAAPAYFGGSLSFGELMMVVGAFNQVQQSLRWFVDNASTIADWRASLLRVMNFRQALMQIDDFEAGAERFERVEHPQGLFALDDVVVMSAHRRTRASEAHLTVKPGERVLFTGLPGAGKGIFFLAIGGLWNWGSGRISLPPAEDTVFLAQRPFVPPGSIRTILTYTNGVHPMDDDDMKAALKRVGLGHLGDALDRVERWDRELTNQDRQLLALARVLLMKPKWVFSDGMIDMIRETQPDLIHAIFDEELAGSSLISIYNKPIKNALYDRLVALTSEVEGEAAEPGPATATDIRLADQGGAVGPEGNPIPDPA